MPAHGDPPSGAAAGGRAARSAAGRALPLVVLGAGRADAFSGAFYPAQRLGNRGVDVLAIQHLLQHHGHDVSTDGRFTSTVDSRCGRRRADGVATGAGDPGRAGARRRRAGPRQAPPTPSRVAVQRAGAVRGLQPCDFVGGEGQVHGGDGVVEVFRFGRADDGGADARLGEQPRQRDLCGGNAVVVRDGACCGRRSPRWYASGRGPASSRRSPGWPRKRPRWSSATGSPARTASSSRCTRRQSASWSRSSTVSSSSDRQPRPLWSPRRCRPGPCGCRRSLGSGLTPAHRHAQ